MSLYYRDKSGITGKLVHKLVLLTSSLIIIKMAGKIGGYKRTFKKRYFKKKAPGGITKKPKAMSASRYDGDCWIKVEKSTALVVNAGGEFWAGARTDNATTTGTTDMSYLDAPEYQAFSAGNTYQLCEVRGLRADV